VKSVLAKEVSGSVVSVGDNRIELGLLLPCKCFESLHHHVAEAYSHVVGVNHKVNELNKAVLSVYVEQAPS